MNPETGSGAGLAIVDAPAVDSDTAAALSGSGVSEGRAEAGQAVADVAGTAPVDVPAGAAVGAAATDRCTLPVLRKTGSAGRAVGCAGAVTNEWAAARSATTGS